MSKYIDADKLVSKVKELNIITKTYEEQVSFSTALLMVTELIDTLSKEKKEADIEKIINDYFKDWKFDDELDIMVKPNNYSVSFADLRDIAKHFFELGKNSK